MSEEFTQLISLWGGVASILALLGSLVGAFFVILKKARSRHEIEEKKLERLREKFSNRAQSATTQGKRLDLFIYHQILFSSLHTSQITDGIQRLGFMIYSLFVFFFFASLDKNADYFVDQLPGSSGFVYDNYVAILLLILALLAYTNFRMNAEAKKHKKRISAMVDGIILELQKIIDFGEKS